MIKNIIAELKGKDSNTKLLSELHKIPKKEVGDNMPTFQDFKEHFTDQADILYLPTAKYGFKYLLVVVDTHSRHFDAEPLKNKDAFSTLQGFRKIYDRGLLKFPKILEVDDGNEFKGDVKRYFEKHDAYVRTAMTNRHRQQALVEAKNYLIGRVIFHILNLNELNNKKTSKDWYKSSGEFRKLVKVINDNIKYKPITEQKNGNILITKDNKELLPEGTKVRVTLDYPEDVAHGNRLIGKFRAGDIRFSKDIKTVEWIVLKPNQPPMYKVNGEHILRTRQQLQVLR